MPDQLAVDADSSQPRPHLRGQTPSSLLRLWPELRLDPGVARRVVARLVSEDAEELRGVRGLSHALADTLHERGSTERLVVEDRRRSQVDPFVKYLFRSPRGGRFETVRIPLEKPRWSVCVSSQVGCGLGCLFCETGRLGFERNLEPWEMVEQVLTVRRESPERPVTGVVFQGQGEPLQNYDNVMHAADVLRDPCGARVGSDRITISTVGLLPAIERYTDEQRPYRLILSLTSAIPAKRAQLLPVAQRYAPADLAAAMTRLAASQGGPVNLAFVMMAGVNTGTDEVAALARLFPGTPVRLSLIDVNDPTGRFQAPDADERGRFITALAAAGIGFVRRYSGGPDIHAACGMLATSARGGLPVAPDPSKLEPA